VRDDLPHAMRETARRLEPDVGRLAAGGVSRGTRMRRVERAVQVLGSAVAVTVVFAGVTLLGATHRGTGSGGGIGGQRQQVNQSAASDTESEQASGLPTVPSTAGTAGMPGTATTPDPTTSAPGSNGTAYVTQQELISALKTSLGGTGVTARSFVARGSDSVPPEILVEAQLSVTKNVGHLGIVFARPGPLPPGVGVPQLRPDGSVVYSTKGSGSSDGRNLDRLDLQVTLVRTDGSVLTATETNTPTEKSAALYDGAPLLLSPDQLAALLDSSLWDDAVGAAGKLPSADSPESGISTPSSVISSPSSASS
jgi:hypothetical protein